MNQNLEHIYELDRDLTHAVNVLVKNVVSKEDLYTQLKKDIDALCNLVIKQLSASLDEKNYDMLTTIFNRWDSYSAFWGKNTNETKFKTDKFYEPENVSTHGFIFFLKGRIIKCAMDKTVTLLVERHVKHPKYGKFIKKSKKYLIHDENSVCKIGDLVIAVHVRPLSKRKSFCYYRKCFV